MSAQSQPQPLAATTAQSPIYLPKNDPNKAGRQTAIAHGASLYQWTTSSPNLPGIPLAVGVPSGEGASAAWLALAFAAQRAAGANESAWNAANFFNSIPKANQTVLKSIDAGNHASAGSFTSDSGYIDQSVLTFSTSNAIRLQDPTNTTPTAVYQTERYGSTFSAIFPNIQANGGSIYVRLHFAEIYFGGANQRVFDVTINGVHVIRNLDIFKVAGGANIGIEAVFEVFPDAHGTINIAFTSSVNNAKISGIEIIRVSYASMPALTDYDKQFKLIDYPDAYASYIKANGSSNAFNADPVFAYQRLAGPNPLLITAITALPAKFPVTNTIFQSVMGTGDNLQAAGSEGRLFLVDYAALNGLDNSTAYGQTKYSYAPIALFAVPKSPANAALKPVAIQCTQTYNAQQSPIFHADGSWAWEMAKTVVQNADASYHETISHLSRTHLVIEAFIVAMHRTMAPNHPIFNLLFPTFEGTVSINDRAANGLIAPGGPIDIIFAAPLHQLQQAVSQDRLNYHWNNNLLPNDLTNRGVDTGSKIAVYPYRDDAKRIWGAIHTWATNYVNLYYTSDNDVSTDSELSAWILEVTNNGKLKGVPTPTKKEELVRLCTGIIFTATAQHAAVNFPQKSNMMFAPAYGGASWAPAPVGGHTYQQSDWIKMLTPLNVSMLQIATLYVLGSVQYGEIADYEDNGITGYGTDWFSKEPEVAPALTAYRTALSQVETAIIADDKNRLISYPHLRPSLIPCSLNI